MQRHDTFVEYLYFTATVLGNFKKFTDSSGARKLIARILSFFFSCADASLDYFGPS